jgi:Xaa-Pro aminopeptidase
MKHKYRLNSVLDSIEEKGVDVLLVTHLPNIRYLCGFTGSAGAIVVSKEGSRLFTDGRYTEQARNEVVGCKVEIASKPPLTAAAAWLKERRRSLAGRKACYVGIEGEHLTVAERRQLSSLLPSGFQLKETSGLVERLRMVKDADEIKCMRAAGVLGASLFGTALKTIRPGVKETEVAAEMEYAARCAGAEGMSFPTIIAAGKRSALPHGRASTARIPSRGFVVCDFGVILAGYCSDRTRTVHVGPPGREAQRMYEAVREAQSAAIAAVKPGIKVGEVDHIARKLLEKSGFGKHFTHSTGHGVGLEIHEAPRVASGQTEMLIPGMVITIEPGVYVPERGGVRIEDVVVVTERGCEILSPSSTALITI